MFRPLHLIRIMSLPVLLLLLIGCSFDKATPEPVPTDTHCFFRAKQTIVILGSSTAEGVGASRYDSSWAGRLRAYSKQSEVINLAKSGYYTGHILPTKQATSQTDTNRNVNAALRYHPTCIIISMTTNDIANGVSVEKVMKNIAATVAYARENGVRYIFVTTPHPRNISPAKTAEYLQYRDEVLRVYGDYAVNFYDIIAGADQLSRPELIKDGLHPNDRGHALLFGQVLGALLRVKC